MSTYGGIGKKAFLFLQTSRATQHVELLVHNQHSKAALRISKEYSEERAVRALSFQPAALICDEAAFVNHRL